MLGWGAEGHVCNIGYVLESEVSLQVISTFQFQAVDLPSLARWQDQPGQSSIALGADAKCRVPLAP